MPNRNITEIEWQVVQIIRRASSLPVGLGAAIRLNNADDADAVWKLHIQRTATDEYLLRVWRRVPRG